MSISYHLLHTVSPIRLHSHYLVNLVLINLILKYLKVISLNLVNFANPISYYVCCYNCTQKNVQIFQNMAGLSLIILGSSDYCRQGKFLVHSLLIAHTLLSIQITFFTLIIF